MRKDQRIMSKIEYEKIMLDLCLPTFKFFSEEKAQLNLPNQTSTTYSDKTHGLESFARVLWGIGPYAYGKKNDKNIENFITGIINGTNPQNSEYWGDITEFGDQRFVEMPSIALFIYFTKEYFWDELDLHVKKNISNWFLQINTTNYPENNWLFFKIMVNMVLKLIGAEYDEKEITSSYKIIETFYLGDGWYSDGVSDRRDYYISFAIHYYSLIYAKFMENNDSHRCNIIKERAGMFAKDYINWFSTDGSAVPFGRSLTYRFSQVAFWSAIVLADVEVLSLEVIKGIINRNLRWWLSKPICNSDGLLSVGYTYPNPFMAEEYNAEGSPYWALKPFILLALDSDHKYWDACEAPMPELKSKITQKHSRMIIRRDLKSNHVAAFVNGQKYVKQMHGEAKYEKFVYSNIFGFSIARSAIGLHKGAYDSTLAVSDDGEFFKHRHNAVYSNIDGMQYSVWKPWKDVEIKSTIVPGLPWHVRIHKVKTNRTFFIAEGGFSIERKDENDHENKLELISHKNGGSIRNGNLHSGIVSLLGNGGLNIVRPSPNTNILYSKSELPMLNWKINKGEYIIVSAILGDNNVYRSQKNYWEDIPKAHLKGHYVYVELEGQEFVVNLETRHKLPVNRTLKMRLFLKKIYNLVK